MGETIICPKCGSYNVTFERDMDATHHCGNCYYSWKPYTGIPAHIYIEDDLSGALSRVNSAVAKIKTHAPDLVERSENLVRELRELAAEVRRRASEPPA